MGRNIQTSSNLDIENIMEDLFEKFKKAHETKEPFLLFDISNAKENDHTRFLKRLLSYRDTHTSRYLFLESFCKTFLDITFDSSNPFLNPIEVSDQKTAVGVNKGKGFIDLYIKVGAIEIVIENKILGASDCKDQLNRYVYSINHPENKDGDSFQEWYENIDDDKFPYVLYLTKKGDKEPSINSLKKDLREKLLEANRYKEINYQDHILPWLEEIVLPNCPCGNNGELITGVQQYIAYLRYFLNMDNEALWMDYQSIRKKFNQINDVDLYKELTGWLKEKKPKEPDEQAFKNQIELFHAQIFEKYMPDDSEWAMHFTPSFIELYKKSWIRLENRKYYCPSLAYVGNTTNFLNGIKNLKWQFRIAHLPAGDKKQDTSSYQGKIYNGLNSLGKYQIVYGNHDLNADFKENLVHVNTVLPTDRKNYLSYLSNLIITLEDAQLTKDVDDILKNLNQNS